jgi:3-oxoacyl-[acyl-carrier protein] reductase
MTKRYTEKIKKIAEEEHTTFEEQMNEEVSNVPLRKYAEPVEVAKAVEGLLSEFTDHMTGTNFICDGGFTRAY